MIGTKTVLIDCPAHKGVPSRDYLVDICLIYALISFLSFVVLTGLLASIWAVKRKGRERWGRKGKYKKEAVL